MNTNKMIAAAFSALISSAVCMCCCMNGFAAGSDNGSEVSKGLMAFIMIAVFVVSAAAAGFITFRLRTKKLKKDLRKDETSGENSPRS